MTRKQAFGVLGLAEGATPEEIKRAYRRLAFDLHPDLHPDNPDAGKAFQRLNEAYVLLSVPPSAASAKGGAHRAPGGSSARSAAGEEREATEKARADARKAYERAKGRFDKGQARPADASGTRPASGSQARANAADENRTPDRDEVLRDLLRDPFARRVFEDIYSQIRNDARRAGKASPRPRSPLAQPGLMGTMMGSMVEGAQSWLRRQIDEEQTVQFAGTLTPGARVRLQVSQGLLSKPRTIELTLPPEFEPGRPIRLKGMGKRIGKWCGDLYLRIVTK